MSVKFQDYYKTLDVERDATPEQISKAYRKLARKYHPDVNKAKGAEDKFKQLNEAHEVLKNPESRKRYDALGENWKAGQQFTPPPDFEDLLRGFGGAGGFSGNFSGGPGNGTQFDSRRAGRGPGSGPGSGPGGGLGGFSDFFNMLFGDARGQADGGQPFMRRSSSGRDGANVEATLGVTLEDVYRGASKPISLDLAVPQADGSQTVETKVLQVKIPPGVVDGKTIRLTGQGGKGFSGGKDGDLLLKLKFFPHPIFWTDANTVYTRINLSPWEAILGATVPVTTLDGQISLRIPPGAQAGQSLRIKGKGMRTNKTDRADMFVQIGIVVPKSVTESEKELFEKLKRESSFEPGKDRQVGKSL